MTTRKTTLAQELEALVNEQGLLTPRAVLAAARPQNSALHEYFTWDDGEAAEKWRIEEARRLIRSVTVTFGEREEISVPVFVSLPADRAHGDGYRTLDSVRSSSFLMKQLLAEVQRQIQMWQERAQALGYSLDVKAQSKKRRRALAD